MSAFKGFSLIYEFNFKIEILKKFQVTDLLLESSTDTDIKLASKGVAIKLILNCLQGLFST